MVYIRLFKNYIQVNVDCLVIYEHNGLILIMQPSGKIFKIYFSLFSFCPSLPLSLPPFLFLPLWLSLSVILMQAILKILTQFCPLSELPFHILTAYGRK